MAAIRHHWWWPAVIAALALVALLALGWLLAQLRRHRPGTLSVGGTPPQEGVELRDRALSDAIAADAGALPGVEHAPYASLAGLPIPAPASGSPSPLSGHPAPPSTPSAKARSEPPTGPLASLTCPPRSAYRSPGTNHAARSKEETDRSGRPRSAPSPLPLHHQRRFLRRPAGS